MIAETSDNLFVSFGTKLLSRNLAINRAKRKAKEIDDTIYCCSDITIIKIYDPIFS